MIEHTIFFQFLAALWLVGSAFGLGLYRSRRNKQERYPVYGYIWVTLFSWAFVGWLAGELLAYNIKAINDSSRYQEPTKKS